MDAGVHLSAMRVVAHDIPWRGADVRGVRRRHPAGGWHLPLVEARASSRDRAVSRSIPTDPGRGWVPAARRCVLPLASQGRGPRSSSGKLAGPPGELRNLVRVLRRFTGRPLRILDLGAGSGWLSARLTEVGHSCVAVDWLDDAEDGLGAIRHYPIRFTCVQADFDDLPLAPGQFDVAIFNASLHYSNDPARTLRQPRAMLPPGRTMPVLH